MNGFRIRICRSLPTGVIAVAVIGLAATGCGGEKLESARLDREIAIDGTNEDWNGAFVHLEERPVSIGVMNDDEYLYLCFVTDDPMLVRQVVTHGMTVGFRGDGVNEDDSFRVLFPVGGGGAAPPPRDRSSGGERPTRSGAIPDSVFDEAIQDVELQGPGGREARTLKVAESHAVVVAAGRTGETFVYEMRLPLEGDDLQPYAVGATAGEPFELFLSTPEIDLPEAREPMGDRGGGGRGGGRGGGGRKGGGGGGRGGGGGMSGRGGGGPPTMPEPLDAKFEVVLAAAP